MRLALVASLAASLFALPVQAQRLQPPAYAMVDECTEEAKTTSAEWLNACLDRERDMRAILSQSWADIPAEVRKRCEERTLSLTNSRGNYDLLATCISLHDRSPTSAAAAGHGG